MKRLRFSYDAKADVLTIEGLRYSGDLFRAWGHELRLGEHHSLIERRDGVITLERHVCAGKVAV